MSATPAQQIEEIDSVVEAFDEISLLKGLSAPLMQEIAAACERRAYAAGQTVFSMGQYDGSEFFIVRDGVLRVAHLNAATGAMTVDDIKSGGFFGLEPAIIDAALEDYGQVSVTAETDITALVVDAFAFREIATQSPELLQRLCGEFAKKASRLAFKTDAFDSAPEQRVYAALFELAERDRNSGEWRIAKMPKHRELADLAGVDEAIAAAAVATIIQDGVAKRNYPGLVVLDLPRLQQLAN